MQLDGRDPGRDELPGEHLGPPFGPGEDHRPAGRREQLHEDREAVVRLDVQHVVVHLDRRLRGRVHVVRDRLAEELPDQHVDAVVQGRREQQPLAAGRRLAEQSLDDRQEAQVSHVVGLVEHGDLDGVERRVPVADVVVEPARAGDQDVDSPAQGGDLWVRSDAAEDGERVEAHRLGERSQARFDLGGQLPGRGQDEGTRAAGPARLLVGSQAGHDGQHERVRLPGSGPPATEQIAPGERIRQRRRLDRERCGDAEFGERAGQDGRDA